MWVECGKYKKKFHAREVTEKKFLQSELHCWAYKLYPSEAYLGSHYVLQFSWSW